MANAALKNRVLGRGRIDLVKATCPSLISGNFDADDT
jgi:hypothetical protein